jgi:hypothetical protein
VGLKELFSGYGGFAFPLPSIAGSCKGKKVVVCGDAHCVWIDLELFGCRDDSGLGRVRKEGWEFMAVNKLGECFPGHLHHWYSNQPAHLANFVKARRNEYEKEFTKYWITHSCGVGADFRWPWGGGGTSSLGAALVAIGLGYERVVLCGVPLDNTPHNGQPHWRKCNFENEAAGSATDDRDGYWKRAIQEGFEGKVRSMSGRTAAWLGRP